MTNEIVKSNNFDLENPADLDLLKKTIAKNATGEELAMFVQFCRATGLNPFKREIWFIKTAQGVQIMTGINGFYSIANTHPMYDGTEVETFFDDKGKPTHSIAKVWRKDRRFPSVGIARWNEFGKTHGNWRNMPILMLEKCSESLALRKAFPQELNGMYTVEEMPERYDYPDNAATRKLANLGEITINPANIAMPKPKPYPSEANPAYGDWGKFVIPIGRAKGKTIGELKDTNLDAFVRLITDWFEPIALGEKELDENLNDFYLAVEEAREFYMPTPRVEGESNAPDSRGTSDAE